jgi:hypothetical protein
MHQSGASIVGTLNDTDGVLGRPDFCGGDLLLPAKSVDGSSTVARIACKGLIYEELELWGAFTSYSRLQGDLGLTTGILEV